MSYWVAVVAGGVLLLALLAWAGCGASAAVPGNGQIQTETRLCAEGIRSIRVEGPWQVDIYADAEVDRCVIRTDANLFEHLKVDYRNGKLTATVSGKLAPTDGMRLTIHARGGVEFITKQGAADMHVYQLHGDSLVVQMAGSGEFNLTDSVLKRLTLSKTGFGDVRTANADIAEAMVGMAGAGDMRLFGDFGRIRLTRAGSGNVEVNRAGDIELDLNGSGDAVLTATKSISGYSNGSGNIRCSGTGQVTVQKQGSGKIYITGTQESSNP